jgi:hypothetical protein
MTGMEDPLEGPEEGEEPIGEEEREMLQQDLVDVQALKELLGPRGLKGVVFYCPDCGEDHYLAWDLLAGNLREMLEEGESPVHEPAFDPDPNDYVSWDYSRGFLDGYESFGEEDSEDATMRLILELRERGWNADYVIALLQASGIPVPRPAPEEGG